MSKSIEIQKIVLRVGGKEIALSLEEARELQKILNDAFERDRYIYVPYTIPAPYPYPHWTITYGDTGMFSVTANEHSSDGNLLTS